MLGDPSDPLALEDEPKAAQLLIESWEKDDLTLDELEQRLDGLLHVGQCAPTLDELYARREREEERIKRRAEEREEIQQLAEDEIARTTKPTPVSFDLTADPDTFVEIVRQKLGSSKPNTP